MTDEQILTLLLDKGGLPAVVMIGLGWIWWKFPSGRVRKPEPTDDEGSKVAARIEASIAIMSSEIRAMRDESHTRHIENATRFAILETEVKNLKERK